MGQQTASGTGAGPGRLPTGVPGLDEVLGGGLLVGGLYLAAGLAGTGKTVLGNQICFHQVARGGRAVFVTLLAESHARLLGHLRDMRFFDGRVIGDALYYVSGFAALEEEGLDGLARLLRTIQREREAGFLVLDGLSSAESTSSSELPFKRFLSQVQGALSTTCTTALLLSEHVDHRHPAYAMVDGLLELSDVGQGMSAERRLSVRKLRGSEHLRGGHVFEIDRAGVRVFPRVESRWPSRPPLAVSPHPRRISTGVADLDRMLGGGLTEGSSTVLVGSPGSGKTLLGQQFLVAGAQANERGLHYGFYETADRLARQAAGIGCDLPGALRRNLVRVVRRAPLELRLDEVCQEIVDVVRAHGARRLFLDSVGAFEQAALHGRERLVSVVTALTDELRADGVTCVLSAETYDVVGGSVRLPLPGMSAALENAIFLRVVEVGSRLRRALSVLKVRESAFDPAIREFFITSEGFRVGEPFGRAEGILSGQAHQLTLEEQEPTVHTPLDAALHGREARGDGDDSHR